MHLSQFIEKYSERLRYGSWVLEDPWSLYLETPKAACSTIKLAFHIISGRPIPENTAWIHYRNDGDSVRSVMDYADREASWLLSADEVFRFCFVRNPYSRLVSAYKDKIQRGRERFWQRYRTEIVAHCSLRDEAQIEFEHFVDWVCSQPDSHRDPHWRSQVALLRPDVIRYQFVGKQESFRNDFAFVLERLAADRVEELLSIRENETSASDLSKYYRSRLLLDSVYKAYAQDFDRWGYARSIQLLW